MSGANGANGMEIKYLTFDTPDVAAIAAFWGGLLRAPFESTLLGARVILLSGSRLLFLPVPEPKTAKNRFHPDYFTNDLDHQRERAHGMGATELNDFSTEHGFVAFRDPDGNEFCIIEREGVAAGLTLLGPTFDTADPGSIASWWAELMGGEVEPHELGAQVIPPSGHRMLFARVPEPKTAKNRNHPDLHTTDLDADVARVLAMGALETARLTETSRFVVFLDPDGNEFCIVEDEFPDPEHQPE